jgi:cytochrome P450
MSLKLLVNNPDIWKSLVSELEERIELAHKNLEQMNAVEELYRMQGEARAYRKLLNLRDKVNAG